MVPWPVSVSEVRESSLSCYRFSKTLDILFCGTCSGPLFWRKHTDQAESLGIFTGALKNIPEPAVVSITDHICVEDTVDGGASPWLRWLNDNGTESRRWKGRVEVSEEITSDWPSLEALMKVHDKKGPDVFRIQCHCKGVDLELRRGDADFETMTADELPFFVDPTTYKQIATFDACSFCRPMFGVDIIHWTFALLQHLDFPSGPEAQGISTGFPKTVAELKDAVLKPERDPRFGTLAMYASSDDVQRYFCSCCSATILYAVDDRQDLVDVAVGVLSAPDGARAESLLLWGLGSNVGGEDDVEGSWREGHVRAVKKAAEDWRIARGYPKTWRRIALEKAQDN